MIELMLVIVCDLILNDTDMELKWIIVIWLIALQLCNCAPMSAPAQCQVGVIHLEQI